jgi:hypothetical protein
MCRDAAPADDDRIAFVATHSCLPNGQLVIERIVNAANVILAARRAKWTPRIIAVLEDDLVTVLERFRQQAKRVEVG